MVTFCHGFISPGAAMDPEEYLTRPQGKGCFQAGRSPVRQRQWTPVSAALLCSSRTFPFFFCKEQGLWEALFCDPVAEHGLRRRALLRGKPKNSQSKT